MRKFKEVKTNTIVGEDFTTKTTTKTLLHTIRDWQELTLEEKQAEIEARAEIIYSDYQEELWDNYEADLEELQEEFKNITFDTIYLDSNSQGGWIDSVKNFKYHCEGIEIYGEWIDLDDIDLHIRRYFEEVGEEDVNINDYYIEVDKIEKIKKTKKYQKWINQIVKDVNNWIDKANEICAIPLKEEYNYPSMLSIEWEKDWLDNYFSDTDFETIEEIEN